MELLTVLKAISSTEPSSFREFCSGLGDACPERGDTNGWREVFRLISKAEKDGLVDVLWGNVGFHTVILSESGAAHVRANPDRGW